MLLVARLACVLVLNSLDVLGGEAPVACQVLPVVGREQLLGQGPGQPLHLLLLLLALFLRLFGFGTLLGLVAAHALLLDVHQAVAELPRAGLKRCHGGFFGSRLVLYLALGRDEHVHDCRVAAPCRYVQCGSATLLWKKEISPVANQNLDYFRKAEFSSHVQWCLKPAVGRVDRRPFLDQQVRHTRVTAEYSQM
uniref:Secreted protein n=1 Tax=Ixodes ricinus TaxID=34613 RepID=A0A6B0V0P9_IXORI